MAEFIKNSMDELLHEFYRNIDDQCEAIQSELSETLNGIKNIPFVQKIIDENNMLKTENARLLMEIKKYKKLDVENINLEINEKPESIANSEFSEDETSDDEISVGGEQEDLLIN